MEADCESSVSAFITCLWELAATCEYGNLQDSLNRDRLEVGIADKTVQKKLFSNAQLTLTQAIADAITSEATDNRMHKLETEASNSKDEMHFVSKVSTQSFRKRQGSQVEHCNGCNRCGDEWHRGDPKKERRAWGKKCNICGILNHFGKVCKKIKSQNPVHRVEEDNGSDSDESVYTVDQQKRGKKYSANLNLSLTSTQSCSVSTLCQIDTGSTTNVMPIRFLGAISKKG